ncbi:MAG: hypothetical protein M1337_03865 [Actinobacteria bacterium]|nr:hypothetical protein [Actinomycetota bacterium]
MQKIWYTVVMAAGIIALIAAAWMYVGKSTAASTSSTTAAVAGEDTGLRNYARSDDGGGSVLVDATILVPGALAQDSSLAPFASDLDPKKELGIALRFTTHSGDLKGIDMVAAGELETPAGARKPVRWVSESDDSHHRAGTLVFSADGLDLGGSGKLVLRLSAVAGAPLRQFEWELPQ